MASYLGTTSCRFTVTSPLYTNENYHSKFHFECNHLWSHSLRTHAREIFRSNDQFMAALSNVASQSKVPTYLPTQAGR